MWGPPRKRRAVNVLGNSSRVTGWWVSAEAARIQRVEYLGHVHLPTARGVSHREPPAQELTYLLVERRALNLALCNGHCEGLEDSNGRILGSNKGLPHLVQYRHIGQIAQ